ncbi:MAG TPA: methyltransferase domain-containing protein [Thermoplasmata archaeon]|nr:methyltransferase domain-containing protein [Thermoplasmata archaeon]
MPLLSGSRRARGFFDRLAPLYDWINARIYKPEWLADVRATLHGRVLDVGVGTGFTTGHLADAVGIDLSQEMLRRARYRGHLLRADVTRPPFREGSFDTVVLAGSFYYLSDPQEGMAVAARLLRPGGIVVVLSPATWALAPFVRIYSREEYEAFMAHAGLQLASYRRLNWAACLVTGTKS